MAAFTFVALVFLAGLTVCGLSGALMELAAARRLRFSAPFVSSGHMLRSIGATACAGPLMLMNEALDAHRGGHISLLTLLSCLCTVGTWITAMGIVMMSVAARVHLILAMPV